MLRRQRAKEKSVWQTWLEDREGVRDNPWETAWWTRCPISALLLPPCVLCHGYQTGLPMQPVNVFFSGRSERGTNVSRSVSYTINVNCPGMHEHKEGGRPRNIRTAWMWKRSLPRYLKTCCLPLSYVQSKIWPIWKIVFIYLVNCDIYLIYMIKTQHMHSSVCILLPYFKVIKTNKKQVVNRKKKSKNWKLKFVYCSYTVTELLLSYIIHMFHYAFTCCILKHVSYDIWGNTVFVQHITHFTYSSSFFQNVLLFNRLNDDEFFFIFLEVSPIQTVTSC